MVSDREHTQNGTDRPSEAAAVIAALRAWAERQPLEKMFVADALAEQIEALAECPENEILHGLAVGSLRQLGEKRHD